MNIARQTSLSDCNTTIYYLEYSSNVHYHEYSSISLFPQLYPIGYLGLASKQQLAFHVNTMFRVSTVPQGVCVCVCVYLYSIYGMKN